MTRDSRSNSTKSSGNVDMTESDQDLKRDLEEGSEQDLEQDTEIDKDEDM
jgi:hypothetical protein